MEVRWAQRGRNWLHFGLKRDTFLQNVHAFVWSVAIRTGIQVFYEVEIQSMRVKLIKCRLGDDSQSSNKAGGFSVVLSESFWGDNEAGVTKNINHFILLSVDKSLHFCGEWTTGGCISFSRREGSVSWNPMLCFHAQMCCLTTFL